jgi:hypothetical protein
VHFRHLKRSLRSDKICVLGGISPAILSVGFQVICASEKSFEVWQAIEESQTLCYLLSFGIAAELAEPVDELRNWVIPYVSLGF